MRGAAARLPVECVMSDRQSVPILTLFMVCGVNGSDCNTWRWLL